MNFWWKFAIALAAIAGIFAAGMHYQALRDAKTADALLQAQQEANQKAQEEWSRKSQVAEQQLAAERARADRINSQWEKEKHEKHSVCTLSPATIRLLAQASGK